MTALAAPYPGAPPKKKGWSTWSTGKKVLVVFLSILGGLVVISILGSAYGWYWLMSAGDQAPAAIVISERSGGFIAVHAEVEDPGVKKLILLFDRKMKEMRMRSYPAGMPEPVRRMLAMQSGTADLEKMWPREITVSFEPVDPSAPASAARLAPLAAINLQGMGGMVRAVARILFYISEKAAEEKGRSGAHAEEEFFEYRGHRVFKSRDFAVSLAGSTVVFGTSVDALKAALDRADDLEKTPLVTPARLAPMAAQFQPGSDAHLALGELRPIFAGASGEPADEGHLFQHVALIGAGFDLASDDELKGQALLECDSDGAVLQTLAELQILEAQLLEEARGAELELEMTYREAGPRSIRVEGHLTGIARAIERGFDRNMGNVGDTGGGADE